jgi:CubicO group peptidase (beta-lactamase class C family)
MGIGIHGQMLYVDRPRGVVVAKQSSWPNPDSEEMHLDAFNACRAIAHALG